MIGKIRNIYWAASIVGILLAGAFVGTYIAGWYPTHPSISAEETIFGAEEAPDNCPHTLTVSECPFCTPALIEAKGFCNGHGVPEALCHLCDPSVIPAFKAKGDWCAEHDAPESLCPVCAPGAGLKFKKADGVALPAPATGEETASEGNCPHGLERVNCPWCTPKLMVERGFCTNHRTPEAFCAVCDPGIIPGLKAMDDWCKEHGQSETFCTECNPASNLNRSAEKCPHGISQADCPFCNPELIVSKGFCNGHGVPEAFCHLCNPAVIPAFKSRGDWCDEHDAPESWCPVCSPAFNGTAPAETTALSDRPLLNGMEILQASELPDFNQETPVQCDTESLRVRLAPNMAERIGLTLAQVRRERFTEEHNFNAQIDYNRNRLTSVSPRAPGVIVEVFKEVGDTVKAGDPLAVIDSIAMGNAKAALLQAAALVEVRQKDHEREQRLLKRGVSTEKDRLDAEAAMTEAKVALSRARQTLRNLGFDDREIENVRESGDTGSRLIVTAPFDGEVIERYAGLGEMVDTTTLLFRMADVSRMWAMLDIYESELSRVKLGQPVQFTPDSQRDRRFAGRIVWIGSAVDPQTRTLPARAELPNLDRFLKANMFGRATVTVRDGQPALVVPKEAVQWEGCCHIVFERLSDMLYAPRRVQLGHALESHYEIEAGLSEGTPVVTRASFLLKTEIMKGSIGAGCCELNPGA